MKFTVDFRLSDNWKFYIYSHIGNFIFLSMHANVCVYIHIIDIIRCISYFFMFLVFFFMFQGAIAQWYSNKNCCQLLVGAVGGIVKFQ